MLGSIQQSKVAHVMAVRKKSKKGGRAKVSTSPSREAEKEEEELGSQHPFQGDTSNDLMPSNLASPLRDFIISQQHHWLKNKPSVHEPEGDIQDTNHSTLVYLACDPEKVPFHLLFTFDTGNDNVIIETGVSWISL